jgi:hypothetical protein
MSEFATALFETVHKPEWVIAYATIVIALFAIILGLFIASLAESARRAAKVASKALIELERPWLFVESAKILRREMSGQENIPNNWYISFKVRNVGRSPAIIKECIIKIEPRDKLPRAPNYSGARPIATPQSLSPKDAFDTQAVGSEPGDPAIRVAYGRLTYTELNSTRHHSGFAVEVSPQVAAYSGYSNSAYNYYD